MVRITISFRLRFFFKTNWYFPNRLLPQHTHASYDGCGLPRAGGITICGSAVLNLVRGSEDHATGLSRPSTGESTLPVSLSRTTFKEVFAGEAFLACYDASRAGGPWPDCAVLQQCSPARGMPRLCRHCHHRLQSQADTCPAAAIRHSPIPSTCG
jgi:hypothetical protein